MPARCALQPALERSGDARERGCKSVACNDHARLASIAMLLANSPLVWATCLALNAVTAGEANAEESADQQVRFAQAGASQLRALTVDQPTSRVQRRRVGAATRIQEPDAWWSGPRRDCAGQRRHTRRQSPRHRRERSFPPIRK